MPESGSEFRFFWGKTDDRSSEIQARGQGKWLSVYDHLLDTGEFAELLWDEFFTKKKQESLSGGLDPEAARNRYVLLCALHDIGKITPAFYVKSLRRKAEQTAFQQSQRIVEHGFRINGGSLSSDNVLPHNNAGFAILSTFLEEERGWRPQLAYLMGVIVAAHHGMTPDKKTIENFRMRRWIESLGWHKATFGSVWREAQQATIQSVIDHFGGDAALASFSTDQPAHYTQLNVVGAVIFTDWMASRYGLLTGDDDRVPDRIRKAWDHDVDLPLPWRANDPGDDMLALMKLRFESKEETSNGVPAKPIPKLRDSQRVVLEEIKRLTSPGITIIEAPMGEGKTETAILAAEYLASRFQLGGFVFALPTMATTDRIWDRVIRWAKNSGVYKRTSFYLGHSQSSLNDSYGTMLDHSSSHQDIVAHGLLRNQLGIYSSISVTTIDKVLPLALKHSGLFRLHFAITDKVVILDEVHSYDAYTSTFLETTLEYLGVNKVPVILLSATLSSDVRNTFISHYMKGAKQLIDKPKIDVSAVYPSVVTATASDGERQVSFTPFAQGKEITVSTLEDDNELLSKELRDKLKNGGTVAVIRTTVARAQKTYQELKSILGLDWGDFSLLHSRFTNFHRNNIESDIESKFGSSNPQARPFRAVVVATQVIEQSLDIDFDLMISDAAPIDLIFQRLGRLWRHDRAIRPVMKPHLILTGTRLGEQPDTDDETLVNLVYQPYIIEKSMQVLSRKIRERRGVILIPEDISSLVEETYSADFKNNLLSAGLKKNLPNESTKNSRERMVESLQKEQEKARDFVVPPPYSGNSPGLVSASLVGMNDYGSRRGSVRDITGGISAILLTRDSSGKLQIPFTHELVSECQTHILDDKERKLIAQQIVRLPDRWQLRGESAEPYIKELLDNVPENWKNQPGLRGIGAIIADADMCFAVGPMKFRYSLSLGLEAIL